MTRTVNRVLWTAAALLAAASTLLGYVYRTELFEHQAECVARQACSATQATRGSSWASGLGWLAVLLLLAAIAVDIARARPALKAPLTPARYVLVGIASLVLLVGGGLLAVLGGIAGSVHTAAFAAIGALLLLSALLIGLSSAVRRARLQRFVGWALPLALAVAALAALGQIINAGSLLGMALMACLIGPLALWLMALIGRPDLDQRSR